MPVEILMPELGESVHSGTVSRWIKKVGDTVKEDEPIVEIMTDKVNTELPSPSSGVLVQILVPEGGEVEVFQAMGIIEADASKAAAAMSAAPAPAAPQAAPATTAPAQPEPEPEPAPAISNDGERRWYSPLVKAIAKEHGLTDSELALIAGSGNGGRVNKKDVETYLANRSAAPAAKPAAKPLVESAPAPKPVAGQDVSTSKLVGMRKAIADAMVRSSQVPVVSTLIEIDVTPMVAFRSRNKDAFQEQYGVKLTYTPFFIKALSETLLQFPMLNSSLADDTVTTHHKVHMGCAVSLGKDGEGGLIVPVIRDTDTKNLVQVAKDLEAIAAKARSNALGIPDVQGGTFTLTNPGSYGAVLGTPMINAPQAGILGVYGIQEKVVVKDGLFGVRSMMNVVLTYDHRLVDGLMAGRFLQAFKAKLEQFDFFK
jgi:pyruvate/2-oxoglutarate dehydrogenase complex dihydrolipoamide acyltransferase (E2) component